LIKKIIFDDIERISEIKKKASYVITSILTITVVRN